MEERELKVLEMIKGSLSGELKVCFHYCDSDDEMEVKIIQKNRILNDKGLVYQFEYNEDDSINDISIKLRDAIDETFYWLVGSLKSRHNVGKIKQVNYYDENSCTDEAFFEYLTADNEYERI